MSDIDLLSPGAIVDPHGFFGPLRDADPVQWSQRHRAWIVMGHPELNEAFHDRRLSTERMSGFRDRLSGRRPEALPNAIDLLELRTGETYLPALNYFFQNRQRRLAS